MNKLTKIINVILEEILQELAVGINQAESENLALFVGQQNNHVRFVLYVPEQFKKVYTSPSVSLKEKIACIKGYISVDNSAQRVVASAANKGYGPLMYELALSFFGKSGLEPDVEVSDSAKNIWKTFFLQRKSEFNLLPAKKKQQATEDYLNFRYVWKNQLNPQSLQEKHFQTIEEIASETSEVPMVVESYLVNLARDYFGYKYGQ